MAIMGLMIAWPGRRGLWRRRGPVKPRYQVWARLGKRRSGGQAICFTLPEASGSPSAPRTRTDRPGRRGRATRPALGGSPPDRRAGRGPDRGRPWQGPTNRGRRPYGGRRPPRLRGRRRARASRRPGCSGSTSRRRCTALAGPPATGRGTPGRPRPPRRHGRGRAG